MTKGSGQSRRAQSRARFGLELIVISILTACRAPEPAPEPAALEFPPALERGVNHHSGSLLGGAVHFQEEVELGSDPAQAWQLRIRMLYLERSPSGEFAKLSPQSDLVATPTELDPLRAAGVVGRGTQLVMGQDARALLGQLESGSAGRQRSAHELVTALPEGCTAVSSLANITRVEDPDNFLREWALRDPVPQALELHVSREASDSGQAARVALIVQGLAPARAGGASEDPGELSAEQRARRPRPGSSVSQREILLPHERPTLEGGPFVLLVPSPFAGGEGRAFALIVELHPAPAAGSEEHGQHLAALERCLLEVEAASSLAARRAEPVPADDAERRSMLIALRALEPEREGRATLVYLAEGTGAKLLADLALDADVESLPELTAWLIEEREALEASTESDDAVDSAALGWRLERTSFHWLSQRAMNDQLAPELEAVLLRHAGEVGRYPSVLQDLLAASRDLAGFEAALIEEQYFFLEDSSPASRVRAFDWLAARRVAPEAFDPLDDADARRAALKQDRELRATESAELEEDDS